MEETIMIADIATFSSPPLSESGEQQQQQQENGSSSSSSSTSCCDGTIQDGEVVENGSGDCGGSNNNNSSSGYVVGDTVYCYSFDSLYIARIMKIQPDEMTGEILYLIHYHGWSTNVCFCF
jgi:hypothetical protein